MNDALRTGWQQAIGIALFTALQCAAVIASITVVSTMTLASNVRIHLHNDLVEVVEFRLPPGAALEEPHGRHRVIVALSRHSARYVVDDGSARELDVMPGDHRWLRASTTTRMHNIGDTEARFLDVRSRVTPFAPDPPGPSAHELSQAAGISELASDKAAVRLDNAHFRVTEYRLERQASLPAHLAANQVLIALEPVNLRRSEGPDRSRTLRLGAKEVAWIPAGHQVLKNLGPSMAHFMTVEIKPPQRYTDYEP